jgi:hypothetical protein
LVWLYVLFCSICFDKVLNGGWRLVQKTVFLDLEATEIVKSWRALCPFPHPNLKAMRLGIQAEYRLSAGWRGRGCLKQVASVSLSGKNSSKGHLIEMFLKFSLLGYFCCNIIGLLFL